jgi:hypothetical protein
MIRDNLFANGKLVARTIQPLVIYYKDSTSHNECYDIDKNKPLDINDIDDSYGLEVDDSREDCVTVMIPRGVRVKLRKPSSADFDCKIEYKNIEIELTFEDEPMDSFFEELE